ncbi:MAG: hypothetical protein AAGE76_08615 [Pseudomonadota bacterium]
MVSFDGRGFEPAFNPGTCPACGKRHEPTYGPIECRSGCGPFASDYDLSHYQTPTKSGAAKIVAVVLGVVVLALLIAAAMDPWLDPDTPVRYGFR